jgi:hypothetical protein
MKERMNLVQPQVFSLILFLFKLCFGKDLNILTLPILIPDLFKRNLFFNLFLLLEKNMTVPKCLYRVLYVCNLCICNRREEYCYVDDYMCRCEAYYLCRCERWGRLGPRWCPRCQISSSRTDPRGSAAGASLNLCPPISREAAICQPSVVIPALIFQPIRLFAI